MRFNTLDKVSLNSFTPGIWGCYVNTLRPRQKGQYFADEIFKCIFLNEDMWISINISLKFVPKGLINNIPASFQIMDWLPTRRKPLSEPRLPTHICVTRPQWVKVFIFILISRIYISLSWGICHTTSLIRVSIIIFLVMAWCNQAPELVLTKLYEAIWCFWAIMS